MDDFSIATSSTSAEKNCTTLKSIAESLIDKATEKGIQFESGKTKLIYFHSHCKEETESLTINGHDIKPKSLIRWLGIWFDSRLSFKQHVEKKLNSAIASFFGLQHLGTLQQGLSFRALRQLYIACVTTIADFRVPLWYNNNKQGLLIRRYQNLQNIVIRHMLGAFKGSPTRALELEAAILPPEIRFEKLCNMYALRTLRFQLSHPVIKAVQNIANDKLGE